jgi:hypothetical protein
MRIERCDRRVEAGGVVVVEEQAHAHAAFGGLPQRLEKEVAGLVAMPDVILNVE